MKFKKGDTILVTAGKDKGKKGKIEKIFFQNQTVFVPGLNVFKKHLKKKDEKNPGGIVDFSRPLSFGNIAFFCPKCSRGTRIGFSITGGEKFRVCKKCQTKI